MRLAFRAAMSPVFSFGSVVRVSRNQDHIMSSPLMGLRPKILRLQCKSCCKNTSDEVDPHGIFFLTVLRVATARGQHPALQTVVDEICPLHVPACWEADCCGQRLSAVHFQSCISWISRYLFLQHKEGCVPRVCCEQDCCGR